MNVEAWWTSGRSRHVRFSPSRPMAHLNSFNDGYNVAHYTPSNRKGVDMRIEFWNRIVRSVVCTGAVAQVLLLSPMAQPQSSAVKNVFLIVMSNQSWSNIKGNPNAPYINSLLPMAASASSYSAILGTGRPMLADNFYLEAGTDFGVSFNAPPTIYRQVTTKHLVDLLEAAGTSWKAHFEDINGNTCPLADEGEYKVSSNPFVYFEDMANETRCLQHVRPYSEFAGDLNSRNVAGYNFIRPNSCNSMLQCPPGTSAIAQGDKWLSGEVPKILASDTYKAGGALFIVWDHPGGTDDDNVGMILLSPFGKHGYNNTILYTHASTLRTMQEIFGVTPWLGQASSRVSLEDLFTNSGSGNSTALLSWNSSVSATSYKVMRGSSAIGPFSAVASGLTSTNYVDRGLTAGATYFYRVSAVNDSGESPPSPPISVTIGTVPLTPTNVTVKQGP